jgi:pimeloyl-ACP methyl ester carboxylesterase
MLSEGIAGRGVASLRFDKRGVGASHSALGNESDLRFGIYVDDAAAWIRWLDADPRFSRVTVLGHSERSLVGMLAARVAPADVFISVAGPARRGSDILRGQLRPQISEGLRKENERILGELEAGRTVASVPEELATLYRPSIQPYLISWFRHLPSQEIAAVTQPTFVLHGTQDLQVPVAEAEALRPARPDVELRIVSGMNHVLKLVPANPVQQNLSYSDPALPVAPELIKEMTRFTSAVRSAP